MSNDVRRNRAKLAANMRHHPNADHTNARRELAASNLEAYVARVVAEAPPLTDEQKHRIASLLGAAS